MSLCLAKTLHNRRINYLEEHLPGALFGNSAKKFNAKEAAMGSARSAGGGDAFEHMTEIEFRVCVAIAKLIECRSSASSSPCCSYK